MNELRVKIGAAQRRMAVNAALDALALALVTGAGVGAFLILADRLFFLELPTLETALWLLAASAIAAAAISIRKIPRRFSAALLLDEKAGTRERFSSALLVARETATPMSSAFLNDAMARCRTVNVGKSVPLRLPRRFRWLPLPLAAAAGLYLLMPEADLLGRRADREERAQKKQEIEKLVARPLQKQAQKLERLAEQKNLKQIPPIVKHIEETARRLEQDGLEKKDALAKISGLIDEGRKKTEEMKENMSRMAEAMKTINKENGEGKDRTQLWKDLADGKWDEAMKDLKKLEEEVKEGKLPQEKLDKLKEDLKELAEKMEKLDEKNLPGLTPEDLKALEGLEGALDKLAEGLDGKDLEKMLENLARFEGELLEGLGELELSELALEDLEWLKEGMLHAMNECPDGAG